MTELYRLADNLLMYQTLIYNTTVNESRAFRKEKRVWLSQKKTRTWIDSGRQKHPEKQSNDIQLLSFPCRPWVNCVSPDGLASVPRTRESNQINIIRLLCAGGWRKTTSISSKSSFHSMTVISKEKLTLLKGLLQCYPYILMGMSYF